MAAELLEAWRPLLKDLVKPAVGVALAVFFRKRMNLAVSPGLHADNILTFWYSVFPSEYPWHFAALQAWLISRGTYGAPSALVEVAQKLAARAELSAIAPATLVEALGILIGLSAFLPLFVMARRALNSRAEFAQQLAKAGVPLKLAGRRFGVVKTLASILPSSLWLRRNIVRIAHVPFAKLPRHVTPAHQLRHAAQLVGIALPPPPAEGGARGGAGGIAQAASVKLRDIHLDLFYHTKRRLPNAPCLLYIHGGGWTAGRKEFHSIPLLLEVARRGWLVATMDYRLAPTVSWGYQLMDCKRAIAWLRAHAAEYGADPSFVVVAGESAGGHLATMCGVTGNVAAYQREGDEAIHAEHVDTAVDGVVDLYGVMDYTDSAGVYYRRVDGKHDDHTRFIERFVVRSSWKDHTHEFVRGSPIWWLCGKELPERLADAGITIRRPEEVFRAPSGSSAAAARSGAAAQPLDDAAAAVVAGGIYDGCFEESLVWTTAGRRSLFGLYPTPFDPAPKHDSTWKPWPRPSSPSAAAAAASPAGTPGGTPAPSALIADMCVDRPVPPILAVHGDVDTIVPVQESRRLFELLAHRRARERGEALQRGGAAAAATVAPACPDVYLESTGAHHAFNFMTSVRTMHMADAIGDWLEHLHAQTMKKRAAAAAAR